VTGANRVELGTKQPSGIRNDKGEPMADKEANESRSMEGSKWERDVILSETTGEMEIVI